MSDKSVYVFGIVKTSKNANETKTTTMGGEETKIYAISYKDLKALVGKVPAQVYEPKEENVVEHQRVLEKVMKNSTVIPMSFGTTFKSEGDVTELLKQTYSSLKNILKDIKGRIEMGVKVFWDEEKMIKIAAEEIPEEQLEKENVSYQERIEKGQEIESILEKYKKKYTEDIHEKLKTCSVASRANDNISEDMIFNAAFLIEKNRESDFDEKMQELGKKYEGELEFRYSGPWPPYNFVNIELKIK